MTGVEVALVDWEEGQYRVADKPRPRGEVRDIQCVNLNVAQCCFL